MHAWIVEDEHEKDRNDLVMCLVQTNRVLEGLQDCVGLMESTRDLEITEDACREVLDNEAVECFDRVCQ